MAIPPKPPVGEFEGGSVFIDGDYAPLSEGKISLFDWGFTRSDATYDVASVWNGAFFRLDDHIDRFFASLAKLRMKIPYTPRRAAGDPARLRARRRPAGRLRGDGLHARRAAARLARSAPGDQPLLCLRAALRLDRAAREAARRHRPAHQRAPAHRARIGRSDGQELPLDRPGAVDVRRLRPRRRHQLRRRCAGQRHRGPGLQRLHGARTAWSAPPSAACSKASRGAR